MEQPEIVFYFDYVDPACALLHHALRVRAAGRARLVLHPFELFPPPRAPVDPVSPDWRIRCAAVERARKEYGLSRTGTGRGPRKSKARKQSGMALGPALGRIPWSRKAHELMLHARAKGCSEGVHTTLFQSFFEDRADIGRIDVLVALAEKEGLDATETKAVLDVDRYAKEVEELRRTARAKGVMGPPTLDAGRRRIVGLPDRETLRRFLG